MTPLSACVQAGHDSAYITLESRQPEHWNLKEAPSYWHLLIFSTNCGSMKFLTIQFTFHEVSEPNTTRNNTVSRDTKVTCCVDIMRKLCLLHTHTWVNTIGGRPLTWLWLAGVWGVDRYDGADYYAFKWHVSPNTTWHTASSPSFWPYADLLWLKLLHACHITFELLIQGLTLCFSFSLSGNNWSWAVILV